MFVYRLSCMFALPYGAIGRICSVIVALPWHLSSTMLDINIQSLVGSGEREVLNVFTIYGHDSDFL